MKLYGGQTYFHLLNSQRVKCWCASAATTSCQGHHIRVDFLTKTLSKNQSKKTSQELPMSSVTLNCQITKFVMNSVFQSSEFYSVSQMSMSLSLYLSSSLSFLARSCALIILNKGLKGSKSQGLLL